MVFVYMCYEYVQNCTIVDDLNNIKLFNLYFFFVEIVLNHFSL